MTHKTIISFALILLFGLTTQTVFAHPGRTDGNGGHYCRTNCTKWGLKEDEYHKHNASGGYTTSSGTTYDKEGNKTSEAPAKVQPTGTPTPTPKPAPVATKAATPLPVKAVAPVSTPVPTKEVVIEEEGEVLGVTEEVKEEPTSTVTPEPKGELEFTPTPVVAVDNEADEEGSALVGFLTLAAIGGGSYYFFKKLRRKHV